MAGIATGVAIAGLAISAGSAAYGIYNSESQKAAAAKGGGGMDKKSKKYLKKEADRGLNKQNEVIGKYEQDAAAAGAAYRAAGLGLSSTYMDRINTAVGDYDTQNQGLVAKSDDNARKLEERSATIGVDSANQALDYNKSKMQDYIAFADALSMANTNTAQRMLFANNPGLEKQQQQALLLSEQGMNGMLSSGTQAMLARRAAQMGNTSGAGFGSQLSNNFELRDLGIAAETHARNAALDYRALRSDIYDQTVAGRQVGSEKIMDFMGLNSSKLLDVNQANNIANYTAGQNTIDIRQTGLNNILSTKSKAYETDYSNMLGMEGNIYNGTLDSLGRGVTLRSNAVRDWTSVRTGGILQSWANENSRAASNATLNAANTKAVTDSAASAAALGLDFYKDYKSGAYNSNTVSNGVGYGDTNAYKAGLMGTGSAGLTDTPAIVTKV
jgi:hypothetical protein